MDWLFSEFGSVDGLGSYNRGKTALCLKKVVSNFCNKFGKCYPILKSVTFIL